jgi:hypothetical protein
MDKAHLQSFQWFINDLKGVENTECKIKSLKEGTAIMQMWGENIMLDINKGDKLINIIVYGITKRNYPCKISIEFYLQNTDNSLLSKLKTSVKDLRYLKEDLIYLANLIKLITSNKVKYINSPVYS